MQGPSNRRKDFIDPKKWALRREQQKAEIKRLEAIQEKERRKHPQRKDFLQQSPRQSPRPSYSKVDLHAKDNRIECFDAAGHLISVNGVPIGLDGEPIFEEIQDLKGNLISLNNVPIKEIEGFRGVIRDQHGVLLSMRGPPYREEIRNPEGRMISLNGALVAENREDIKLIVRLIRELTGIKKKNLVSKLLTTVGAKPGKKTFKEIFVKRIQKECKATHKQLKEEVKRAKKMEDYLKNQEKADKKAAIQENKQRTKMLEKELARMEKQKIKELEAKAKDRKKEQEIMEKEKKIGAEARKLAGTIGAGSTTELRSDELIERILNQSAVNDVVTSGGGGGDKQLGSMVQTVFMKYSNNNDSSTQLEYNDNGSYYTTSSSSEDESDDPAFALKKIARNANRPNEAIKEFKNQKQTGGALDKLKEEHAERMRIMQEEIRKKDEEKRALIEKQQENHNKLKESEMETKKRKADQDTHKGKNLHLHIIRKHGPVCKITEKVVCL